VRVKLCRGLNICKVQSDMTEERDAELYKLLCVAVHLCTYLSAHDIQRRLPHTQRFGIPTPVEERNYLLYTPLQVSPGAHTASSTLGTGLFARVKVL